MHSKKGTHSSDLRNKQSETTQIAMLGRRAGRTSTQPTRGTKGWTSSTALLATAASQWPSTAMSPIVCGSGTAE